LSASGRWVGGARRRERVDGETVLPGPKDAARNRFAAPSSSGKKAASESGMRGLAGSLSAMYTNLLMLRRAPERTVDERRDALEEANRVRFARAATKRDLKNGNLAIYDLLMDPSEELKGAKVEEMLLAVKGMGRIKVTRVMRDAGISRSKTLVGLTHGQRDRLIRTLGCEEG
jgi:hypothetical protein